MGYTDKDEATNLVAKESSIGNEYWWKDPGKKRYEIQVNWTVKTVEVKF